MGLTRTRGLTRPGRSLVGAGPDSDTFVSGCARAIRQVPPLVTRAGDGRSSA